MLHALELSTVHSDTAFPQKTCIKFDELESNAHRESTGTRFKFHISRTRTPQRHAHVFCKFSLALAHLYLESIGDSRGPRNCAGNGANVMV